VILEYVSILILGLIGVTSLFKQGRSLLAKYHWRFFIASALSLFSYATYQGAGLYQATYEHPIGKFFDIEYVLISRIGVRIFAPYLISLIVAMFFMWIATKYNKKYNERFFEKEEIQIGGLSILLVGHPGWIFYLPAVIFVYLLLHIYHQIRHKSESRLPVYHLWVPTAIFVILISEYWLFGNEVWSLLKI